MRETLLGVLLLAGVLPFAAVRAGPGVATTDEPRAVRVPVAPASDAPMTVLRGGTLIDATGAAPVHDAILSIQGDRIMHAGPADSVTLPPGPHREVDVSGLFIVPGLIDLHVHVAQEWKSDDPLFGDSDAAAAIRGTKKLSALLDGGITTARDVGTRNDVAFRLKQAVERRIIEGPRIFWAGKQIMIRGGHGDETRSGVAASSKGTPHSGGAYARVANGAEDWRLAVREQIRADVDLIKLFAPFSREEVSAAITEAHMQGFRVTVDAYGKYTTWAVEAGADSIEHTLAPSRNLVQLMARQKTALVPTVTAYYTLVSGGWEYAGLPPGGYYRDIHRSFDISHEANVAFIREAHEAGVKIGVGTDMGFAGELYYPEMYFTELGFLKDAALTDEDVLLSATHVGAQILGMQEKLGTLEIGKIADILVVRGNPLVDFRNLQRMQLVIADGAIVRNKLSE